MEVAGVLIIAGEGVGARGTTFFKAVGGAVTFKGRMLAFNTRYGLERLKMKAKSRHTLRAIVASRHNVLSKARSRNTISSEVASKHTVDAKAASRHTESSE
jgi:hypothetical protein